MPKSVDELLPERGTGRLRIYAWSTNEIKKFEGCLKVGQTTRDVNFRIKQSQGVAQVPYTLEVNESAEREDGTFFRDSAVRERLKSKGFENVELEWMRCSAQDVLTAIKELQSGVARTGTHIEDFKLRSEQIAAIKKTDHYFRSIWAENNEAVPRFLWNAKMRFGKTFAAYSLAKKMDAKKVLVVTFKPAVEDAWQSDLESHVDFRGWQYFSKNTLIDPSSADKKYPLVYFGSFQDLLGKDKNTGTIKAKNEWVHSTSWDLVIFDEYHFGAWRESAKELFEGEEATEAKKETQTQETSLELDEDLKLLLEYKKSGKTLSDFVKEYQVEDVKSWSDDKIVKEGLKEFMQLSEEEYEQAISEFESASIFQKKQWAESFKQKFEEKNSDKLKQLMSSNQQSEEYQKAVAAKYNEEMENFSQSIVNKELYGLKITDEMSKDLRNFIDNEFRLTKEDGSFDIEKIYSVAVWLKYGKDLVKANITKAKNEGREQVIKEVTNPSKNMTGGGRAVGSGLEAVQEAFNTLFPG